MLFNGYSDLSLAFGLCGVILGLLFGSAINAFVWRLYVGRSWVKGRSECPDCGHTLHSIDLVPVLSWLLLKGKCRYCRKPIKDHPVVELATALLCGFSGLTLAPMSLDDGVRLAFWAVLLVMLIVLAVYDARWLLLPDKVVGPLIMISLLYAVVMAVITRSPQVIWGALAAGGIGSGAFYAIAHFTKGRAMGGGDIKLVFAMGLILGEQSLAVALLLAFNVAAIVGLAMIAYRKKGRKDQIPFGPYLVAGTVIAFLYGREIVSWYMRINGLS